jgi:D-tagatose-1,6-bisphosphate aldolase subunit GatZ/KbaZ
LLKDTADFSLSEFSEVLDEVMSKNPVYWQNYYRGSASEQRIARLFSLSDRCRYYLGEPEVVNAISKLLKNLGCGEVPLTLLSQFLPEQYYKIREGKLENNVANLIKDKIRSVIDTYPKFS